ncbi:MAG: aldo/keto reductase [Sandarakinorhabdus sp.]|nr:aldo/keto reductase [Sandarakinorhabdus sp.]
MSDAEAKVTLAHAWTRGIRSVDTAPLYGHGRSETRIGSAMRSDPAFRFGISTKVGRSLVATRERPTDHGFVDPMPFAPIFDYCASAIEHGFAASLQRLGVHRVETLLLHDIGARTHGARHPEILELALTESLPAMRGLQAAGLAAAVGLGVNEWQVADEVLDRADLDVVLLAGRYTLLEQGALALLDKAQRRGVAVHIAGVFNSGLLAGGDTFDYGAAPTGMRERVAQLQAICDLFDVPIAAAALQFPMAHPAVSRMVIGLGSPAEIDASLGWLELPIPADFWVALKRRGLLNPAAPTP